MVPIGKELLQLCSGSSNPSSWVSIMITAWNTMFNARNINFILVNIFDFMLE